MLVVAFVFGVLGVIAFVQVQALRREVRELRRQIEAGPEGPTYDV